MSLNAGRIQDAASRWLSQRSLELDQLQPPQFRQAIDDVTVELKVPKAEVLDQLMAMWTTANERGQGKENLTGGGVYQGAADSRALQSTAVGARIQALSGALTAPAKTDLNTLFSAVELDAIEKPFQRLMRSGGEGLSAVELRADLHVVQGAHTRAKTPDRSNEMIDLPPGTQLMTSFPADVPAALNGRLEVVPPRGMAGKSLEGMAEALAERFAATGKPQAFGFGDALIVVDSKRPDATSATEDWQKRANDPTNFARTLSKTVSIASQRLHAIAGSRPDKTDLGALLAPGELELVEKSFQRMMRSQGEGLTAPALKDAIATMQGALHKIDDAAKTNALLDSPSGTRLMTQRESDVPAAMKGHVEATAPRGVGGKTFAGVAQELADVFARTGVPQAFRCEDALMIVDDTRPDAATAVDDWKARNEEPRDLAGDLSHALYLAKGALADLER